ADASGNVVKQVDYDTFGNVINDTAPEFTVLLGFAGGLYDPDGLIKQFLFNQFINQSVKSISYAYLDIEPAGRRIFSTGIGGGVSGAVGGAISGSTIGGIGAVPGALVGSVAGFGGGVIVQSFLEAAGVGQVIEDLFNEMKDNLRDLFIGNDDSGLCP
ncbi:MAG: hypothetical protein MI799_00115, partial [Desulfobacterales bacterium]|nr:hypothetical protein [Desulfobacterales bacterium]